MRPLWCWSELGTTHPGKGGSVAAHRILESKSVVRWLSGLALAVIVTGCVFKAPEASSGSADTLDDAAIDRYVEEQMKDCRIPGLSLGIVRGDEILYLKGYGVADEAGRPVTAQTPFIIASVSKTFTALALMQLEEEGKVDLDRPVSDYLTHLTPPYSIYEKMTVRQLLNHSAGFDTQLEYRVAAPEDSDVSITELVQRFPSVPLAHTPGDGFHYNNAGYIVLGEVISQVSGLSYEDYLQQHIFDPLEMHHTFTSVDRAVDAGPAVGYRTLFGFPRVSGLVYAPGYLPAFGILSSAEDLTHYMIAMLNGGVYKGTRILSAEGVSQMLTPSISESPYVDYGLGWYVTSGSFYHGGELTDYQAKVKALPEDELGVAFLLNTSSSTASLLFGVGCRLRIETGIFNILYGAPPTDQPGQSFLDLNSHPMALTHFLMLALPILTLLLVVVSAFRLCTLSRRLEASRFRFWYHVVYFALVNVLLPLYLLLVVPSKGVSWHHLLHYIPDVAWFALILSVLLLAVGLGKAVVMAVFLKGRRYPEC